MGCELTICEGVPNESDAVICGLLSHGSHDPEARRAMRFDTALASRHGRAEPIRAHRGRRLHASRLRTVSTLVHQRDERALKQTTMGKAELLNEALRGAAAAGDVASIRQAGGEKKTDVDSVDQVTRLDALSH